MLHQTVRSTLFPYTTLVRSAVLLFPGIRLLDRLVRQRDAGDRGIERRRDDRQRRFPGDRKSTRLNSSHVESSYAGLCLKKKSNIMYIVFVNFSVSVMFGNLE